MTEPEGFEESMTYEEFKKWSKENCDTVVKGWDNTLFQLSCSKCGSDHTGIAFQEKVIGQGSPMTGRWLKDEAKILVKCLDCGNAMKVEPENQSAW